MTELKLRIFREEQFRQWIFFFFPKSVRAELNYIVMGHLAVEWGNFCIKYKFSCSEPQNKIVENYFMSNRKK